MKLQVKFAIYNALSKGIIVLAFGLVLPIIVEKIVFHHIDQRLKARSEKVLKIINRGGINDIIREQDCSFESYNILKEEFVSIKPIYNPSEAKGILIANERWEIEGEALNHRIIRMPFIYDNQMYELNIGEGVSSVEQLKGTIGKFSLWAMIIVVLLSVFIDLGFVRILLKPFNTIVSSKLKQNLSPVSFNTVPVESSTYEFEQLDKSINNMMHKIKDAFLVEKEFISNVSHELQTPISIVQNRLENIVVDGKVPDEIAVKLIESQKTLGRMSRIIRALLLISKIENDQYLKKETVTVQELLNEVLEEIEERLVQKNIRLTKDFKSNFVFSPCNKTLLFTMFSNIINNAIKYNKEGGLITISTMESGSQKIVEIKDNGIGIEKEHLPMIFERFKRVNYSETEGYGLGLTIVKTIASFHNIDLKVESEFGKGTVFSLIS